MLDEQLRIVPLFKDHLDIEKTKRLFSQRSPTRLHSEVLAQRQPKIPGSRRLFWTLGQVCEFVERPRSHSGLGVRCPAESNLVAVQPLSEQLPIRQTLRR